ncbi:MAG: ABC transporter ATP-binding protein [Lachnospiraceae bacterium]|nr:ABC transporter ATP-binding protein [Lachnospiraceae bacterium]MBP5414418.1 ABC transporter ATP-binding protein [Lachnospiraceae bacterium]MBP5746276.1 ABC transporter ATP-binding protein [Lachnospiraceae bacterium]
MVKAEDLYKSYGKNEVLKGASLEASPGTITALVGRNGCGKSTMLQILAGTLKADKSSIVFFGNDTSKDKSYFSKYIGYVPQDDPLFEELSVSDNLKFWAAGSKSIDKSIVDRFELKDLLKTRVSDLSGGMKRRLTIACTLQRTPPVLLLDEPTSSLDLYYQESISNIMKDFVSHGGTIIMSTHNEREIMISDVVYLFENGKTTRISKEDLDMNDIRKSFLIQDK